MQFSRLHSRMTWLILLVALAVVLAGCGAKQPEPQAAPAAAPAVETPAPAAAAPAVDLIIIDNIVRGSKNIPAEEKPIKSCVVNTRFLRNEEVVWRIKVIDPATGEEMSADVLDQVEVQFPDGQAFAAKWGLRPKDNPIDGYWGTSWVIPEDWPTGTVPYTIVATAKDGRTGQFYSFKVQTVLTVLDGAVPVITEG